MFDRVGYKLSGKTNFKRNYWLCVAVSVILLLIGAGGAMPSVQYRFNGNSLGGYNHGYDDYGNSGFGSGLLSLWPMLLAMGVFFIIAMAVALALILLVRNPLEVGGSRFFMENRNAPASFGALGCGFSGNFKNVVFTQFFRGLFIFLWSLLLVIPGIVKAYAYFAVPYILAENPNLDYKRVLELSKAMTYGHKGDLWITDLSFILWYLLGSITLGIVNIFYVNPYVHATKAEIYAFLREQALIGGIATAEELPGFGEQPIGPEDTPNF